MWWVRRAETDITKLRQEVYILEREKKAELGAEKQRKLKDLYKV